MTARDVQTEAAKDGLPWTMAKGYDTFCPVSRFIGKKKIGLEAEKRLFSEQSSDTNSDAHDTNNLYENNDGGSSRVTTELGEITIHLSVNDVLKQRANPTSSIIFNVPRLLLDITRFTTLEEGDLVLTGTPGGVGPVKSGDRIKAGIEIGGSDVEEGRIEVGVEDEE